MADYKGGGGAGGSAIVPASQVVASTRADGPLTQAGLIAAIAALSASGGDIYVGAGTLAVDLTLGPIVLDRDIRIFGAGIGNTVIALTGAGSLFQTGDFHVTINGITFQGDSGSSNQILSQFTAASSKAFLLEDVLVGTSDAVITLCVRTIFDFDNFDRVVRISNCTMGVHCAAAPATAFFILDATTTSLVYINNTVAQTHANITGSPVVMANGWRSICISALNTISLGSSSQIVGGVLSIPGGITLGSFSNVSGTTLLATSGVITLGADSKLSGVRSGAVVADGDRIQISGDSIVSFASDGFSRHALAGVVFTGAATITLADSNECSIIGCIGFTVVESGTSDLNIFDDNVSCTYTLVGPSTVLNQSRLFEIDDEPATNAQTSVPGFTAINPKGVFGIGTFKNTGANPITVTESATDAFGVQAVKATSVAAGDSYMLDLQTTFDDGVNVAYVPITQYVIDVRAPSGDSTYDMRFTSKGAI